MFGNKGSALVLALGILMVAAIFAHAYLALVGIELRSSQQFAARSQAHYLARAGVEVAMAELARDNNGYDALGENWRLSSAYYKEFSAGEVYDVTWKGEEDEEVVNGVTDEAAKININTVGKDILAKLPGMSEEVAEAMVKYRQEKPFVALDEILLVEGMSVGIFRGLSELITVDSKGKVNVNTASPEVLSCLGLKPEFIRAVIANCRGKDGKYGTADDRPFQQVEEVCVLGEKYGVSSEVLSFLLGVASDSFRIISTGKAKRGRRKMVQSKIEVVVQRSPGYVSIKHWWEN